MTDTLDSTWLLMPCSISVSRLSMPCTRAASDSAVDSTLWRAGTEAGLFDRFCTLAKKSCKAGDTPAVGSAIMSLIWRICA